ncbi:MAG: thioredoxin family protein [Acidimicrobiales bacterium]
MTEASTYPLPNGLVAFVKRDCPTCELVAPLLVEMASGDTPLTVFTQDDTMFPADDSWVIDDTDLSMSWHNEIETVPTLIRVTDGQESERTVGWSRTHWTDLAGVELGADLPEMRPGCGSLSVDPTRTDELAVRFGGSAVTSRRIEIAPLEDEMEAMFDRGWSDGLPVVPPTEVRVMRMLEGTTRAPDEVVCLAPPNLVECSVEKVAINAVMAGCRPEYLPVVLAALDAVCTDEFNMHGVLATTMAVGPILVVNGPIRHQIGMNSGVNAMGQGNRPNATIGRAVQLTIRNVGGGRPGEIDRSTQGNPSKWGLCFAEDEEGSAWESLAAERGFAPDASTVTAFCAEGPRIIVDQQSRSPESLTLLLAEALRATASPRMVMGLDAMLVLSPEHMARYRDAGWSKQQFRDALTAASMIESDTILAGADGIDEGLPAEFAGVQLPKFNPDGGLTIVHAGGPAGLFSSVLAGWLRGPGGSIPVTREVHP